jgi:inner membrane transporter RhtA
VCPESSQDTRATYVLMVSVHRVPAPLLAVAAIFSVQFGSAFARLHFDAVGPTGAATLRLVFGAVILVVAVRPRVGGWRRRQWVAAILLGLALAGMNSLIYLALARIPLGVAVTLEFTGPLAVALIQTRRWRDALWALVAFAGVVLLGVGSSGSVVLGGVLLAFGAAAFWAGYIFASSHAGKLIEGIDGLVVAVVVAAIVVTPFGAARAAHAVAQDPTLIGVFLVVALLTSALPYALEMIALRRLETRVFGVLSSLGPAVAALAGLVVIGQALEPREIVALALVTAASVGVTLSRRSTDAPMSHDVTDPESL